MTLSVDRELLVTNRGALRGRIQAALEAGHDVELDLSATGYVDTAAIGMLLRASREAREAGRRLVLAGLSLETRAYFRAASLLGALELS